MIIDEVSPKTREILMALNVGEALEAGHLFSPFPGDVLTWNLASKETGPDGETMFGFGVYWRSMFVTSKVILLASEQEAAK